MNAAPPDEFVCPLTLDIMRDPVICEDGFTYERRAISKWLETRRTSPMTRQSIDERRVEPNYGLARAIHLWRFPPGVVIDLTSED